MDIIRGLLIYFVGVGFAYAVLDRADENAGADDAVILFSLLSWIAVVVWAGAWLGRFMLEHWED